MARAGDPLFEVDPRPLQAVVDQANAQLRLRAPSSPGPVRTWMQLALRSTSLKLRRKRRSRKPICSATRWLVQ